MSEQEGQAGPMKRSEGIRVGGGGKMIDRRKSQSPKKAKLRGEEFLKKIEQLKSKLQLEGKQIQASANELGMERRAILQSEKITESQQEAQERLRRHQEKKREEELRPKVSNYNDLRKATAHELGTYGIRVQPKSSRGDSTERANPMRMQEESKGQYGGLDENDNMNNIPPRAKTGVGLNSNMRRVGANGEYILPKPTSKKVSDEMIL